MKKLLFMAALAVFGFTNVNAQDDSGSQTSKGKWLIEANTGNAMVGSTGFHLTSFDGETDWNVGLDGGYFIMDDLALKAGLGYGDSGDFSTFSYRLGAKYYAGGNIPLSLDLTGASIKDFDENPLWIGLGAGYAWFLGEHVSIEPGLRYNMSLNDDYTDEGLFQFNVGFALHF